MREHRCQDSTYGIIHLGRVGAIKWKTNKTYHTVETAPRSNRQIVQRGSIDTHNTHIRHHSLFWLGTDTSIKRGGVKPHFWTQSSPLSEMYFGTPQSYLKHKFRWKYDANLLPFTITRAHFDFHDRFISQLTN